MRVGEIVEHFDPSGKEFKFNFTKHTCTQLSTGICELQDFHTDDNKGDDLKYTRCQNILIGLMSGKINSIKMIPYIHRCACGHWACTDGQHRICVAQKRGLTLKVEREDSNEECPDCYQYDIDQEVEKIEISSMKSSKRLGIFKKLRIKK